jgi:hypothetical protein
LDYSYDISSQNVNEKSIKMFSTQARKRFFECDGTGENCPYPDYDMYRTYYNSFDYADAWVIAAVEGASTDFAKSNADFSTLSLEGRFGKYEDSIVVSMTYSQLDCRPQLIKRCHLQRLSNEVPFIFIS